MGIKNTEKARTGEDLIDTLHEVEMMMYGKKDNDSVKENTNSQNVPKFYVVLQRR